MAEVDGQLTDFGWNALTPRRPILRFHPRAESGSISRRGDRLLSHDPVDATITGSIWTVELVPTVGSIPLSWFELEIIELDEASNFTRSWWWGARVHVPGDGGSFDELPGGPLSPESVWVGLTPPPSGWRGYWLYSPGVGEEMPLDDPNIGMLRRANNG